MDPPQETPSPGCWDRGLGSQFPTGYEVGRECILSHESEFTATGIWQLTSRPSYEGLCDEQAYLPGLTTRTNLSQTELKAGGQAHHNLLGAGLGDPVPWASWLTVLKAFQGVAMTPVERDFSSTGFSTPRTTRCNSTPCSARPHGVLQYQSANLHCGWIPTGEIRMTMRITTDATNTTLDKIQSEIP